MLIEWDHHRAPGVSSDHQGEHHQKENHKQAATKNLFLHGRDFWGGKLGEKIHNTTMGIRDSRVISAAFPGH